MTAPEPVARQLPAATFLRAIRAELRRAGMSLTDVAHDVGLPRDVVRAAVQQRVADWSCYHRILDACGTDESNATGLRTAWEQLSSVRGPASRSATVVPISRHVQVPDDGPIAVPLKDSDLYVATPGEFIALLRRVQLRSGRKPAEIAARAGIPRSTAYRFVDDRRNTALPTKVEQVRAFLTACGLPVHQVQQVMTLWADLQQHGSAQPPPPAVVEPPRPGPPVPQQLPEPLSGTVSRTDLLRFGLAVACVLTTTGLTTALVITASDWPVGPQVLAVMLMAVLSTALAASWCVSGSQLVLREQRRPSVHGGLTIEATSAPPAVIGEQDFRDH
jgi:DNA-binding phage protein